MRFAVVGLICAFVLSACGEAQPTARLAEPSVVRVETPTPMPVPPADESLTIDGPYPLDDLQTMALTGIERLILRASDRTVTILRPALMDPANHRYASIQTEWLDDEALRVDSEGLTYVWGPGGTVRQPAAPLATATAYSRDTTSPDGEWYSQLRPSANYWDTLIGRAGEEPSFRLSQTVGAVWNPRIPGQLALNGNPCIPPGAFDVFVFDANTSTFRNVTEGVAAPGTNIAWHPDGSRLAVDAYGTTDEPPRVLIIEPETLEVQVLPIRAARGPIDLSWSSGGTYLLLKLEGGKGGLFCDQHDDWQPSTVERLSE